MRAMPLSLDSGSDGHGGLRWQPELRDPAPRFVIFVIRRVVAAAAAQAAGSDGHLPGLLLVLVAAWQISYSSYCDHEENRKSVIGRGHLKCSQRGRTASRLS
jgi:hypothetical protein